MADILALKNFVRSDGTEKLVVGYGNDIATITTSGSNFIGQGRNMSTTKAEMDVYLDYLIYVNGINPNLVYDSTNWFTGGARTRMPLANYIKAVGSRVYLANLSFAGQNFRSRVWFPNLPKNNDIQWGYETGTNLKQTAGSPIVMSANAGFDTYGIKTGDKFFIVNGDNAGEYTVDTVDSDQQITLVEDMKSSATNSTYWVGSNWFDAKTNDGDSIRGLGENDNKLLVFKRESLYRYDERELRRVKAAPGTTSHRSIINVRENTYYFHDTGIYRYDGVNSLLISRSIQDWVQGISSSGYDKVVSWRDRDIVYFFVGNVSNSQKNISITNCIFIYDTAAQSWNIGSLNDTIRVADTTISSDQVAVFLGTSSDEVITWGASTTADKTISIPWKAATVFHFPAKAYNIVEMVEVEIHTADGRALSVYYKIYGAEKVDSQWKPLGAIKGEVTKIPFERGTFGRGIAFMFIENTSLASPEVIRIDLFYRDREARNLENIVGQ